MDDIVVCAKTEEEHNMHLEKCMQRLSAAGITLNKAKCKFNQKEIEFLGRHRPAWHQGTFRENQSHKRNERTHRPQGSEKIPRNGESDVEILTSSLR